MSPGSAAWRTRCWPKGWSEREEAGTRLSPVVDRRLRFPWWWWVYRGLGVAAEPLAAPFLGRRFGGGFGAGRLGRTDGLPQGRLWVHAVSVGEARAVAPMVREWLARGGGPILLTVGTRAGLETAARLFSDDAVAVAVAPLDLPGPVCRFLDSAKPRAALFVETELWPVILGECARRGIPAGWVNGRISDRTAAARGVLRQALGWMIQRLDPRLLRGLEDLDRARALAGDGKGACLGDLKYDRVANATPPARSEWGLGGGAPVLVAGSVHEGEEATILASYRSLRESRPALRLVLAPRRLSLVPTIMEGSEGLGAALWSAGPRPDWDVLVVDAMGVLAGLYAWGRIALVGGTWQQKGGQNPLEPAALGVPVLFGPSMDNFRGAARDLVEAGAARSVLPGEVAAAIGHWLDNPEEATRAGSLGRWVVEVRSGAAGRVAAELLARLGPG